MRKIFITLCCMVLLLSSVSMGYCEDNIYATDGYLNGRFIVDMNGYKGDKEPNIVVTYYFIGIFDMIKSMGSWDKMTAKYGEGVTGLEIIESVCRYYLNNPTKRNRSILEVLFEGTK